MSNLSLFSQVGMIIVAIVISFMYIKPTYTNIQSTRDTAETYRAEADKVKNVDDLLISQVNKVDGVSAADVAALKRYIPDSVDDVAVMKDIQAIFAALALPLNTLAAASGEPAAAAEGAAIPQLVPHTFTIATTITYDELKNLLEVIEVNDYLLQVDSLTVTPGETGLLAVTMTLTTFSRAALVTPGATSSNTTE